MTSAQKKAIEKIEGQLAEMIAEITPIRDEAQEKVDNLSEKAADSERGQALTTAAENLDNIVSNLESAQEAANGLIDA